MSLQNKTFNELITFTRSTGGGRFNAQGQYEWLSADQPRFDFDPVTLEPRGILIEEQRTNLLLRSAEFENGTWVKVRSSVSVNALVGLDGTLSAHKLVENTSLGTHYITQTVTVTPNANYTLTVYLKASERSSVNVLIDGGAGNFCNAVADLTSAKITSGSAVGAFTGYSSSITDAGGGWFRLSLSSVVGNSSSVQCQIRLLNVSESYAGDGTSGIYIWGAQLEVGPFPTSYIPTTTAQVTRAADVCSVNNLSPWYRADEGTLMADFAVGADTRECVATCLQGSNDQTDILRLRINSAGILDGTIISGGIVRGTNNMQPVAANTLNKSAVTFKVGSARGAMNGVLSAAPTAPTTLPTVSSLRVGASVPSVFAINGHIRRVRYIPRRISDTELQALTAL